MSNAVVSSGTVYIVGAGPGDPDLLTRRASRLLETADAVLIDSLVSDEVHRLIPSSTPVVPCGKRADGPHTDQEAIHRQLADRAERGEAVVRLHGGDPMVFGRGGEEIRYLTERDIPVEVVPGITAGCAVGALLGVPLTDRHFASEVTLLTGHEAPDKEADRLDWDCLATCRKTLVIYMGLRRLPEISRTLIEYGRDPETPSATVSRAFQESPRLVRAPLEELPDRVRREELESPATTVIGQVVDVAAGAMEGGPSGCSSVS